MTRAHATPICHHTSAAFQAPGGFGFLISHTQALMQFLETLFPTLLLHNSLCLAVSEDNVPGSKEHSFAAARMKSVGDLEPRGDLNKTHQLPQLGTLVSLCLFSQGFLLAGQVRGQCNGGRVMK